MWVLVSAQFKVCISKHHVDWFMRLREKHQKSNFQLKETVRLGAAGRGIQVRETIFAKCLIKFHFNFGYFLMEPIFPNVAKACTWHYFHFNVMPEGCKTVLVQLK